MDASKKRVLKMLADMESSNVIEDRMEYSLEMLLEAYPNETAGTMIEVFHILQRQPKGIMERVDRIAHSRLVIHNLYSAVSALWARYEMDIKVADLVDVVVESYIGGSETARLAKLRATLVEMDDGRWEIDEVSDVTDIYNNENRYYHVGLNQEVADKVDFLFDSLYGTPEGYLSKETLLADLIDDVVDVWLEEHAKWDD